jgi:ribosome biogenesis GTPase
MKGKIIKGIAGFYYVHTDKDMVYECKAKGIFRNQKIKPLVGDSVLLTPLNEEKKTGNIERILPRKNELIRPAVSNVDQAMVVFAAAKPEPNLNLLDRFLISMKREGVDTIICFNKLDIVDEEKVCELSKIYENSGCHLIFTSIHEDIGLHKVSEALRGKTTVLAGPSGVGKSSLMNYLKPEAQMETGSISEKIDRGRHTTRHSELFYLEKDTYLFDTPGFSSLSLGDMEKEELSLYFPEFSPYEEGCRFGGCSHISEPDCRVKEALLEGKISKKRYETYALFYQELKDRKRY